MLVLMTVIQRQLCGKAQDYANELAEKDPLFYKKKMKHSAGLRDYGENLWGGNILSVAENKKVEDEDGDDDTEDEEAEDEDGGDEEAEDEDADDEDGDTEDEEETRDAKDPVTVLANHVVMNWYSEKDNYKPHGQKKDPRKKIGKFDLNIIPSWMTFSFSFSRALYSAGLEANRASGSGQSTGSKRKCIRRVHLLSPW
jgi:cobalamin biosynthesis protein CobT